MEIKVIKENKEMFMELLLLGDEQENMVHKYLNRGELFALYDPDLKTVCVVTSEPDNIFEIKNIATYEKYQRQGYGSSMLQYIIQKYKGQNNQLIIGTGDDDRILSFYKGFGFNYSHTITDFFITNYDHEIFENGKQLKDMIYLKMDYKNS